MKSSGNNPLKGDKEVDEFYVGGPEAGNTGRGNGTKQQVVMAIQTDGFGIHRCYAKVMPSAHSAELQVFFDQHVDKDANIRTDGWKGYTPSKQRYPGIIQQDSAKGKTFPLMHRQIMMFKSLIRGTHHHCTNLQKYIDEFWYRFNRLKYQDSLSHRLIERMVFNQPLFYQKYQYR